MPSRFVSMTTCYKHIRTNWHMIGVLKWSDTDDTGAFLKNSLRFLKYFDLRVFGAAAQKNPVNSGSRTLALSSMGRTEK